jgi:hypothetical protein
MRHIGCRCVFLQDPTDHPTDMDQRTTLHEEVAGYTCGFCLVSHGRKGLDLERGRNKHTCQIKRNNEILQTVAVGGLDAALLRDI